LIKGWAITITGAFVGFAVDRQRWALAIASIGPSLLFWILDSTFLRNERLFRNLFARAVAGEVKPFFMGATSPDYVSRVKREARAASKEDVSSRFRTFWRPALLLFYGAIILVACITAYIVCHS
jgi:hypothetical protein